MDLTSPDSTHVENFLATLERLTPRHWQEVGERSLRITEGEWRLVGDVLYEVVMRRHREAMRGELDGAVRKASIAAKQRNIARVEAMTAGDKLGLGEADASLINAMRRAAVARLNTLHLAATWGDLPDATRVEALVSSIFDGLETNRGEVET
jgi:hypothetical protein